ncbi:MAG TPA: hypothetical protein DIT25_01545 [Candidatus Moranbacteria bacterium]|nr:hypothetical protein [Candidatus Moranbacteria bacterium]
MNKKIILGAAIALLAVGAGIYSLAKSSPDARPASGITLFYGRECSHCKNLEKFMKENKIEEKVEYDYIEVWHNKINANILMEKAKECGISEDKVGVPFLYAEGKCSIGGPDVEKFFKEKAGI